MGSMSGGAQPGDRKKWPAATAPNGWLKENGAAISRTAYAALFSVIGTTFGAGDGVTTFNLPDTRGEFDRNLDDGRGVDAGRGIGTAQAGDVQSHAHTVSAWGGGGGSSAPTFAPSNVPNTVYSTASTGGTETRPRNVAFLSIIKF